MEPGDLGRKLGIGVRVAGRIARQRAQEREKQREQARTQNLNPESARQSVSESSSSPAQNPQLAAQELVAKARELGRKAPAVSRAAGRGIGGFLRPFGRVGSILWLEVTGFFFGLFALYFATDLWRARLGYAQGPVHQRFLIAACCTAVFGYLSLSSFWRARRK